MDTQGIDQMLSVLRATATQASGTASATQSTTAADGTDFASVLQNSIAQVNQTQQQAEGMAANFAAGDSNASNLHEVMISLQKANVSFQEMVQVRNKLVTAYNEMMNMSI